jgi:photosystem II stability/assembly factor-like uncharacterized protein
VIEHRIGKVSPLAKREAPFAYAFGVASLLGALVAGGCTFYTGQPPAPPPAGAGASAATGGRSNSGGGASATGGDGAADAGDTGDGGPTLPDWVDATGNLTGKSVAAGDVQFLSAKPDENLLLAGVAGFGLWGSSDGGLTWSGLGLTGDSDPITNGATAIIYDPVHPKTFWEAGIYGPAVYRTDDGGKTIKLLGSIAHTNYVSIDFTDKDRKTMLAGPHERTQALYLSTDSGTSWDSIGENLPDGSGYSSWPLVIDSQTFLAGCSNMIARSVDAGVSWDKVSSIGGSNIPAVAPDGTIYWGSDPDQGLMRSTDQGATWTRIVGAGVITSSVIFLLPDGRLVSRNKQYVLVSPDGGDTWQVASAPFPFIPQQLVYSAHEKAFFISADSQEPQIPAMSVLRYDWDYETQ